MYEVLTILCLTFNIVSFNSKMYVLWVNIRPSLFVMCSQPSVIMLLCCGYQGVVQLLAEDLSWLWAPWDPPFKQITSGTLHQLGYFTKQQWRERRGGGYNLFSQEQILWNFVPVNCMELRWLPEFRKNLNKWHEKSIDWNDFIISEENDYREIKETY